MLCWSDQGSLGCHTGATVLSGLHEGFLEGSSHGSTSYTFAVRVLCFLGFLREVHEEVPWP